MEPMPPSLLDSCRSQPLVQAACPAEIPEASSFKGRIIQRSGDYETFDISSGFPYGNPRRNRPPRFVHAVVEGGDLSHAYPFALPQGGSETPLSDSLLAMKRADPLLVGAAAWGNRTGPLILMPSYQLAPTIHSDHLMYVWLEGGHELALSLHAWTPMSQTAAVLRAMVESISPED